MEYRKEIDGLRALAVLPVIFFHAGWQGFAGGFVGVDVFFVISGYLITSIILAEQRAGTFRLAGFIERRARRILPALFLMMSACLVWAILWFLPTDMRFFSKSLAAVTLFVSNILFWQSSGYFRPATELIPLLHTWSLAVEEQFYVLFPLFMILSQTWGSRIRTGVLILMLLLSLGLAQYLVLTKPSAAFFLLPTRGWEILLGVLAAFWQSRQRPIPGMAFREVLGGIGLSMILVAVAIYHKKTPFPGWPALLPTLGALLVILYASPQTRVGRLLSQRWLVGMGLISYSAYLWHQPLLAFARYRLMRDLSAAEMSSVMLFVLLLAYGSWRFVEIPFRDRQRFTAGRTARYGLLATFFFLVVGVAGYQTNGFTFTPAGQNDPYQPCRAQDMQDGLCIFGNPNAAESIVLIGDSHAGHFSKALIRRFGEQYKIIMISCSSCFFGDTLRFDHVATDREALEEKRKMIGQLRAHHIKVVIRGQRWQGYGIDTADKIRLAVQDARNFFGIPYEKMIILGSPLEIDYRCHAVQFYQVFDTGPCRIDHDSRARNAAFTRVTRQLRADPRVIYIYPAEVLCPGNACTVVHGGELSYLDRHHLSLSGASRLMEVFDSVISTGE